jgi:hypothetical protein
VHGRRRRRKDRYHSAVRRYPARYTVVCCMPRTRSSHYRTVGIVGKVNTTVAWCAWCARNGESGRNIVWRVMHASHIRRGCQVCRWDEGRDVGLLLVLLNIWTRRRLAKTLLCFVNVWTRHWGELNQEHDEIRLRLYRSPDIVRRTWDAV